MTPLETLYQARSVFRGLEYLSYGVIVAVPLIGYMNRREFDLILGAWIGSIFLSYVARDVRTRLDKILDDN